MRLLHALTVEKTWLNNIDDSIVESYEIHDNNLIHFYDKNDTLIAIVNGLEIVFPAPSGPGFYIIKNEINGEDAIVELKQTIAPSIR